MKSIVHFPIQGAKVLININEKVLPGVVLAEVIRKEKDEIVEIAKILRIEASRIPKYLKKRIGEQVGKGEIIAEKKGFFSSSLLKSPFSGKLKEIDLKLGTLTLRIPSVDSPVKISSPIPGEIKSISRSYIEMETEANIFGVSKGEGKEKIGKLEYISIDKVGVLDIPTEVENKVIVCKFVSEEAVAKLEVLEISGLIMLKTFSGSANITWVQVNEEIFGKLRHFIGRNVWLRPHEHQFAIWE